MNIAAVLIQFRGCDKADGIKRSRQEALNIATEVAREARAGAACDGKVRRPASRGWRDVRQF
jgi:hypothetical protein